MKEVSFRTKLRHVAEPTQNSFSKSWVDFEQLPQHLGVAFMQCLVLTQLVITTATTTTIEIASTSFNTGKSFNGGVSSLQVAAHRKPVLTLLRMRDILARMM
jgi:hypothetical protein